MVLVYGVLVYENSVGVWCWCMNSVLKEEIKERSQNGEGGGGGTGGEKAGGGGGGKELDGIAGKGGRVG